MCKLEGGRESKKRAMFRSADSADPLGLKSQVREMLITTHCGAFVSSLTHVFFSVWGVRTRDATVCV